LLAPQATHWVPEQVKPEAQFEPAQQGWPVPPQVPQVPFMQTSVLALQVPAQHGCPVPPQAVQVPLLPHKRPVPQLLPPQQGWFAPPHVAQVPDAHTVLVALQTLPAQQGWFVPPQAAHALLRQTSPLAHWLPQQGWPVAPQAAHLLSVLPQTLPVPQLAPEQQVCPAAPHGLQLPDAHR
jgi:hypothetical protein